MDELVQYVTEKTGLSEDQAREAVEAVLAYVKDKLPEPIAGQVENLLGGSGLDVEGLTQGLGGMLGGKS